MSANSANPFSSAPDFQRYFLYENLYLSMLPSKEPFDRMHEVNDHIKKVREESCEKCAGDIIATVKDSEKVGCIADRKGITLWTCDEGYRYVERYRALYFSQDYFSASMRLTFFGSLISLITTVAALIFASYYVAAAAGTCLLLSILINRICAYKHRNEMADLEREFGIQAVREAQASIATGILFPGAQRKLLDRTPEGIALAKGRSRLLNVIAWERASNAYYKEFWSSKSKKEDLGFLTAAIYANKSRHGAKDHELRTFGLYKLNIRSQAVKFLKEVNQENQIADSP